MASHYVYILRKPCGEPFYVGKGVGNRAHKHLTEARRGVDYNPHKNRVIRKIIAAGSEPLVDIFAYFDTAEEAYQAERDLISKIGRSNTGDGPLTNITEGGCGVVGYIQTPEIRAAKSRGAKKRYEAEEQRVWAKQNLERARNAKGYEEARLSGLRSSENIERLRRIGKEKWENDQYRRKTLEARIASQSTIAFRREQSKRHQERLSSGWRARKRRVMVNGVEYEMMKNAAEAMNMKLSALSARFRRYEKRGHFPEGWGYIEERGQ